MGGETTTNVRRYCPICGKPVMRPANGGIEMLACSRDHADQLSQEASGRNLMHVPTRTPSPPTVCDDEEERVRRTPGNYC
ncbi:MAG: hypothetical protein HY675_23510 [Chloroflexi bacterium]|nr:hypothetical protein [Chloroflexota bacterium]